MNSITNRLSVGYLNTAYHTVLKEVWGSLETVKRLERAMDILVRSSEYEVKAVSRNPLTFAVTSPQDTYTVIPSAKLCTCPDAALLCKHRLAVRLILETIAAQKRDGWAITEMVIDPAQTVQVQS